MISCCKKQAVAQILCAPAPLIILLVFPLQTQSAIAECDQVICPPADCEHPIRFAGRCCDICIPQLTLLPDDTCMYHGIQISSGDVFRPTDIIEDFQGTNSSTRNECVQCRCNDREITCYDISSECPPLNCNETEATYEHGKCCKQCPVTPRPPVLGVGCYDFSGQFILEGDWWHPILPDYGLVTCVNCTCQNSLPRCERLPCPEVPPCGPEDPIEDVIVCCPRCKPNTPTLGPTDPPVVLNGTSPTVNSTLSPLTPDITPCESPYIYKIYTHITDDALALQNLETTRVEIYNWTTVVGAEGPEVEKEFLEMSEVEFVQESNGEFLFEGWTINRRVRGLMNKPAKRERIEACIEECAMMVTQMLRPVRTLSETLVCGRR